MENFIAPISSVPGNVVQIAVAAVVVLIVIEPIEIAVKKNWNYTVRIIK